MGLFGNKPLISVKILFYETGEIAVQPLTHSKKVMDSNFVELVTLFYIKTLYNLGKERALAEMVKRYFHSIANAPEDDTFYTIDLNVVVKNIEKVLNLNYSLNKHFKVASFTLSDPKE